MRFPVWVLLAGLTAGCSFAQDPTQPQDSPAKTCPLDNDWGVPLGSTVMKGMPYRAKKVFACEETLADGTVAKAKKSFLQWRDSQGRVRIQSLDREFDGSLETYTVQVLDTVDHILWQWDEGKDSSHQTIETKYKFRHEFDQGPTDFQFAQWLQSEGPGYKDVRLPPIWINGVYAIGDLILNVYAPGVSGNNSDHPVTATSESWLSVDLGEIVKSVNKDGNGRKDMKDLFILDRLEPDAALFEPPAGNEVLETKPVGDGVDERRTEEPSEQAEQPGVKAPGKPALVTISPNGSTTVTPARTAPPEH